MRIKKTREEKLQYYKEYMREYNRNNREVVNENKRKSYYNNKETWKKYYEKNKEIIVQYRKEYYKNNIEIIKEGKTKSRKKHFEKIAKYSSEYRKNNKERLNKKRREIYKNNFLIKAKTLIRGRVSFAFNRKFWKKNGATEKLLGTTYEIAKRYIEKQFVSEMNWENNGNGIGEWNIDHIIPLASAKAEEELIKLCHYTNLQPLWAKENREKSAKILVI